MPRRFGSAVERLGQAAAGYGTVREFADVKKSLFRRVVSPV